MSFRHPAHPVRWSVFALVALLLAGTAGCDRRPSDPTRPTAGMSEPSAVSPHAANG